MTFEIVYPREFNIIGGAEHMTFMAEDIIKQKGHTVIRSIRKHNPKVNADKVVFISRQYDNIKESLDLGLNVALIGYYSFYHTFSHVLKSKPQIEHIEELYQLFNYPNFTFITMTVNDLHIAQTISPGKNIKLGTNLLPQGCSEQYFDANGDLLFCGRLCEQKNTVELAKLAYDLPNIDIRVTNVEDADDKWYYDYAHCTLDNIPNIVFVNPTRTVQDNGSYWKGVRGLVLTSIYETMPLVMAEALSKGIPVYMYDIVTADTQCFRNVYVVPQGYHHTMADRIMSFDPNVNIKSQYIEDSNTYSKDWSTIVDAILEF